MTLTLDHQMEEASQALAKMDYLVAEELCMRALAQAKEQKDWAYYGRILMPLQECRRQRRMIAAEGTIRLGTHDEGGGPTLWPQHLHEGCIVITHPHTRSDAARFLAQVRERKLHVQVLFADNVVSDKQWRIGSPVTPEVTITMPAPDPAHCDRWLSRAASGEDDSAGELEEDRRVAAAEWFIEASQKLGDAFLMQVKVSDPVQRISELEDCIAATGDHEILHQRLADAAKAARLTQ